MKAIIAVSFFLTGYLTVLSVYHLLRLKKADVLDRLEEISKPEVCQNPQYEELNLPLFQRIFKPVLHKISSRFTRMLPAAKQDSLQKKLTLAGNPGNLSPHEFMVVRYGLIFGLPFLAGLAGIFFNQPPGKSLLLAAGTLALSSLIPNLYLNKKIARRKENIQATLPDILDLLTVSVEAGLGFDSALAKVIEKFKGVLAQEFTRVLQEIKKGKPRRDALRDLASRCNVEDLTSFISSIVQADQLGVSIGNVLRVQSRQMRQKKRQRAEEQAMKAPVKMLFPLIFFIFPTVFIVLLGPAAIQIMETFSSL